MQHERFKCLRCGNSMAVSLPMSIGMFGAMTKQYIREHKGCKPAAPAGEGK